MADDDHHAVRPQTSSTETFQLPQNTFTNARRARPPTMQFTAELLEGRIPLKAEKVARRESKGLRGMFSRNKVAKNVVLPGLDEPPTPSSTESPVETVVGTSNPLKRVSTLPASIPRAPASPKPASKASRLNLRSRSVKHKKSVPQPSPIPTPKTLPKPPTRTSAAWDPPPLFQAYPQALKHATLAASTLSADSILRISNHRRDDSLRDDSAQKRDNESVPEQMAAAKKAEKAKSKHRRQVSGSISKADWTQQIFVLVTSGYLLQYSGEGPFDRLPEKTMQLGKDSVAFASDVIPGKHWVLQISQSMEADGTPAADARSLLSRLAFRGADYRRTATSLLLVLSSAEEMHSWLAVVRREIEGLGGKKHASETGKPRADETVMQLRAQPSHRYLVQRDPDQFSNQASPTSPTFCPPTLGKDEEMREDLEQAASAEARRPSTVRPSTGHQSIATSVMSHDGRQLENLRDSSNRLSYMSSGQRTLITSQSSSAASSPVHESHSSAAETPRETPTEDARTRPNAAAINERRRSMQAMHVPVLEAAPPPKNYRHSTFGGIPSHLPDPPQNQTPPHPSFSTTNRFPSSRILVPESPAIPTIVETTPTPSRPRTAAPSGTKRGPPVALNLSMPSTGENLGRPIKRQPPVFTPTESSFKIIQQLKPSVIDIPPRSPNATPQSLTPVEPPIRRSSLMPLSSAETAHLDLQLPCYSSCVQAPNEVVEEVQEAPERAAPAPPPPTALPTPPLDESQSTYKHQTTHSTDRESESLSPLPTLANTKQKLCRPASMQIRPASSTSTRPSFSAFTSPSRPSSRASVLPSPFTTPSRPSSRASTLTSPFPISQRPSSRASVQGPFTFTPQRPSSRASIQAPSFQRMRVQAHPKALAVGQGVGVGEGRDMSRKSMPTLMNGPPPAPPPDCALPPLPSLQEVVRVG